jgi:hypothetical protein
MVCTDDWEPRQPQDFVRGVADIQLAPWVRDEAPDTFVLGCTSMTALPGYASPGCMLPGNTTIPPYAFLPPSTFIEP